jgi:hypothetical protein
LREPWKLGKERYYQRNTPLRNRDTGGVVASYGPYPEARKAVDYLRDYLSDNGFLVEWLSIRGREPAVRRAGYEI